MTNKRIIYEAICLLLCFLISQSLAAFIVPDSVYGFIKLFDGNLFSETTVMGFNQKFFNALTLSVSFLLLFPLLFIVLNLRAAIKGFSDRPLNIYILLMSVLSFVVCVLLVVVFKKWYLSESREWTIYPPLSSLPPPEEAGEAADSALPPGYYVLLLFACLHPVSLVLAAYKLFRKNKVAPGEQGVQQNG